jgi:hypothetical protein
VSASASTSSGEGSPRFSHVVLGLEQDRVGGVMAVFDGARRGEELGVVGLHLARQAEPGSGIERASRPHRKQITLWFSPRRAMSTPITSGTDGSRTSGCDRGPSAARRR